MKNLLATFIALVFVPGVASAHAFGQLYNLPVPFWLYLYGGAAAIVVSFLIIGYFFNKQDGDFSYSTKNLVKLNTLFVTVLKFISVFLFLLMIATGFFGENSSYRNFNMTFFWIIIALGLTYLTAIIGNIYAFINPWKILTGWVGTKNVIEYPRWLGYYPALIFYFLFIWLELIGETNPFKLSIILSIYTVLNFLGVMTFGKNSWFRYGEFFSVFFRLIGKIAPIEYREGSFYLRAPFVGLLKEKADHFSLLLFTLFMLSSTAYDGFSEIVPWIRFYWLHLAEVLSFKVFETLGLLISPFVFLIIYMVLIGMAKLITKTEKSLQELALDFAFTLIPIALVYNLAHYYTLIFTEAPNVIRLISDPFGFGWNLLGTADYFQRFILRANFVWHSQVVFILFGHIVSVYLAHIVALKIFSSRKYALLSQFPMLLLMVAYTMIGLWILSQPITGGTL